MCISYTFRSCEYEKQSRSQELGLFKSHMRASAVRLNSSSDCVFALQVYKGAFQGEPVAVKVCKQQHVTVKAMKSFQKEVAILYGCDHPNVVKFKGACSWKVGRPIHTPGSMPLCGCLLLA